ncbi:MAG: 5-formyltetrahydrofolate cyclo-ligase [Patescibacteria group bacterium]|nr:5-formyltetrahydrofolate cyclo-ligase [Patescibacteria group bacterium]
MVSIQEQKRELREKIWKLLEEKGVARFPLPCQGRIPNFEGSNRAAELVTTLPEWKKAKIIFANPDFAQQKVRELALKEGKTLIMATPKLKEGYLEIEPENVKDKEEQASTIAGAFKYGKKLEKLPKPDLIITGCVAVDKNGWRLGKGGGYGDKEITRFTERFSKIPVATTVHNLQIVGKAPHQEFDTKVDYIITPNKVIKCEYETENF